jgi:hypothetical protein
MVLVSYEEIAMLALVSVILGMVVSLLIQHRNSD